MHAEGRSIWIDLDNAPHVPLFAPMIRHYRDRGIEVILTARDHAKTVELLELKGFAGTFTVIGKHYGKDKPAKLYGLAARAKGLRSFIKDRQISLAVSHGSRSMVLAARSLGIPVLTMYDYEYTETRIFNLFSHRVLVPDAIPDTVLDNIGLPAKRRAKYAGLKEEIYISEYKPDVRFRQDFLLRYDQPYAAIMAVLRPPATTANYHAGKSETLLRDLLARLLSSDNTFTVVVPRTVGQAGELKTLIQHLGSDSHRYTILADPVDGLDLAYAADLLISGGGTMNREAALLGTPVYSFFTGRQGALDAEMEADGVIKFIRNSTDVNKISLERKPTRSFVSPTDSVERFVIEQINSFL